MWAFGLRALECLRGGSYKCALFVGKGLWNLSCPVPIGGTKGYLLGLEGDSITPKRLKLTYFTTKEGNLNLSKEEGRSHIL